MAIVFDRVQSGDVLYTELRSGWRSVKVIEIDHVARRAIVSVDGRSPEIRSASRIEKYRRSKPGASR